jgi:hypothetical protein
MARCTPEEMRDQGGFPNLSAKLSLQPNLRLLIGGSAAVGVLILEFGPTYREVIFLGGVLLSSGVV